MIYVGNGSSTYGLSGWVVAIDHGDGLVTTYNHMAQAGVMVSEGDEVREGEIIALVGNEGRSTGPHLHFTVRLNGLTVDPVTFMLSRGIDLKAGTSVTAVPVTDDWLAAKATYQSQATTMGSGSGPVASAAAGQSAEPTPEPVASSSPTPEPGATGSPATTQPTPTETPEPTPTATGEPEPEPSDPAGGAEPTEGATDPEPSTSGTSDPEPVEPSTGTTTSAPGSAPDPAGTTAPDGAGTTVPDSGDMAASEAPVDTSE